MEWEIFHEARNKEQNPVPIYVIWPIHNSEKRKEKKNMYLVKINYYYTHKNL